ncbi:hypothetical protein BpHYR1_052584 [Brachionus plicatilis]|uniref:Uncharacterized protein n=1 Tax=Brachionus plicatilis TaxID=10195 RepID=A0A3M7S4Q0_BRAPC|nr:hypothetical protein BpHYR1_052584 [Brachionus plicatilis]
MYNFTERFKYRMIFLQTLMKFCTSNVNTYTSSNLIYLFFLTLEIQRFIISSTIKIRFIFFLIFYFEIFIFFISKIKRDIKEINSKFFFPLTSCEHIGVV